jgi:hypothetical protein
MIVERNTITRLEKSLKERCGGNGVDTRMLRAKRNNLLIYVIIKSRIPGQRIWSNYPAGAGPAFCV